MSGVGWTYTSFDFEVLFVGMDRIEAGGVR
jgi:hypothetical protein